MPSLSLLAALLCHIVQVVFVTAEMCCTDTCILSAHVRIAADPHAGQREQDAGSTGQGYRGEKSMYQYGWE